jgi:hypothetical protein
MWGAAQSESSGVACPGHLDAHGKAMAPAAQHTNRVRWPITFLMTDPGLVELIPDHSVGRMLSPLESRELIKLLKYGQSRPVDQTGPVDQETIGVTVSFRLPVSGLLSRTLWSE